MSSMAKGANTLRDDIPTETAIQFCVSVGLGIVRATLTAGRKGWIAFMAVFVVAMICGVVAGLLTRSFGASPQWQYTMTSFFTLAGQDTVKLILAAVAYRKRENTFYVNNVEGDFVGNDKDETNE